MVAFLIIYVLFRIFDDNFMYPRIMGNSIGMPSVYVLVGITIGGALFGFGGMLFFIPLTSLIFNLVSLSVNRQLAEKHLTVDSSGVREDGLTVSGIAGSKMAAFKHYAEAGLSLYEGNSNTLVLDEQGEAVTVALDEKVVLGKETFTSPTEWKTEPAAKRDERRTALLARVGRGVLPVYLQFEANSKDEGRGSRFRWSSDDNVKNDLDTVGVVLAGGKVLVLAKIAAADTARLVKLEATLPDGKKASLVFEGSYAEEGALAATFADGI